VFGSLAAALSAAFKIEEVTVRPFLYGLNNALLTGFLSSVLTTVAVLLFPVTAALLGDFFSWASRADLRLTSQMFVAVVLVTAAYSLFRLRIARQRFYGALELGVGIGMVIALIRVPQPSDRLELALKIMAAVYVMIRGLVNIRDAIEKAREPFSAEAKTAHAAIIEGHESSKAANGTTPGPRS